MPILIALLGIIATAYFWANRARGAAHVASDMADMVGDVANAARRFGFRRRANIHPVESIDDPNIALAGIASAFIGLDDLPTKEQRDTLLIQLRAQLRVDGETAQELVVLGQWLVSECGGAQNAITRMSRKLFKMEGAPALEPLLTIIKKVVSANDGALSERQREAITDIQRAFHVN